LTFEQYTRLAVDAGLTRANQIGLEPDSYQLGRYRDEGVYRVGNCRFITKEQNLRERWIYDESYQVKRGKMIVAFMGEYKSGKDFFCDHLVATRGAVRLSFSDEVRRLASQIFPWLPMDITPEQKDLPFVHPQNPNNLTPRQIWLTVGKVRDVDPHFFVHKFEDNNWNALDECYNPDKLFIITDFRTPQEWEFIQDVGIPVLKIERESRDGLPPSDFEQYVREFKDYDQLFINRMNGTAEFDRFFYSFIHQEGAL
jgi:hypothetical protein